METKYNELAKAGEMPELTLVEEDSVEDNEKHRLPRNVSGMHGIFVVAFTDKTTFKIGDAERQHYRLSGWYYSFAGRMTYLVKGIFANKRTEKYIEEQQMKLLNNEKTCLDTFNVFVILKMFADYKTMGQDDRKHFLPDGAKRFAITNPIHIRTIQDMFIAKEREIPLFVRVHPKLDIYFK